MAVALVVAAMLVSGLGEITRQFARTTIRVRDTLEEARAMRLAQAELSALERVEPGVLQVRSDVVIAEVAGERVRFELSPPIGGERRLLWGSGRSMSLDAAARFELDDDGVLRLWGAAGEPPLLVVSPRRTAPFDCRFDVVVRACR